MVVPVLRVDPKKVEAQFGNFLGEHQKKVQQLQGHPPIIWEGQLDFVPPAIMALSDLNASSHYAAAFFGFLRYIDDQRGRQGRMGFSTNLVVKPLLDAGKRLGLRGTIDADELNLFQVVVGHIMQVMDLEYSRGVSEERGGIISQIADFLLVGESRDDISILRHSLRQSSDRHGVFLSCYQAMRGDFSLTEVVQVAHAYCEVLYRNSEVFDTRFGKSMIPILSSPALVGIPASEIVNLIVRGDHLYSLGSSVKQIEADFERLGGFDKLTAAQSAAFRRVFIGIQHAPFDHYLFINACRMGLEGNLDLTPLVNFPKVFSAVGPVQVAVRSALELSSFHGIERLSAWANQDRAQRSTPPAALVFDFCLLMKSCLEGQECPTALQAAGAYAAAEILNDPKALTGSRVQPDIAALTLLFNSAVELAGATELQPLMEAYLATRGKTSRVTLADVIACRTHLPDPKNLREFVGFLGAVRENFESSQELGSSLLELARAFQPFFAKGTSGEGGDVTQFGSLVCSPRAIKALTPHNLRRLKLTLESAAQLLGAFASCPSFIDVALEPPSDVLRRLMVVAPILDSDNGGPFLEKFAGRLRAVKATTYDSDTLVNAGNLVASAGPSHLDRLVEAILLTATLCAETHAESILAVLRVLPGDTRRAEDITAFMVGEQIAGRIVGNGCRLTPDELVECITSIDARFEERLRLSFAPPP